MQNLDFANYANRVPNFIQPDPDFETPPARAKIINLAGFEKTRAASPEDMKPGDFLVGIILNPNYQSQSFPKFNVKKKEGVDLKPDQLQTFILMECFDGTGFTSMESKGQYLIKAFPLLNRCITGVNKDGSPALDVNKNPRKPILCGPETYNTVKIVYKGIYKAESGDTPEFEVITGKRMVERQIPAAEAETGSVAEAEGAKTNKDDLPF